MEKSLKLDRPAWIPLVPTLYGPNALCLELANTRSLSGESEGLADFDSLLAWIGGLGALDAASAAALKKLAARRPAAAKKTLQRAKDLREAAFAVFSAIAAKRPVPKEPLAALNREFVACVRNFEIENKKGEARWNWAEAASRLDSPIWPIAVSAAELLTSPLLNRVRECASATCGWLFLDVSKNSSRRWCDMLSCGNRAKAKRFHDRHKKHF